MTDTPAELRAEVLAEKRAEKRGAKTRSLLPSPPPAPGAARGELLTWLTVALALPRPLAAVTRYGRHDDARMVLTLDGGERIAFDRQADVFAPDRLRSRVVLAAGATVPHYGSADAHRIAIALVHAAEQAAHDDDRGEAVLWAETFLEGAAANTVKLEETSSPEGRWALLAVFRDHRPDVPLYAPASARAVLVLDRSTGIRYARVGDVGAHVREQGGRGWNAVASRLHEIGWRPLGRVEQRQPRGHGRLKARLYEIPAEDTDGDS